MRFSPAESPFSASRMERFLTTSATWKMSPERIFSMFVLYRRLQLVGIRVSDFLRTSKTFLTSRLLTTSRIPTSSVLSTGTMSVRSPCVSLRTKYFFFSPRNSLIVRSSMTAAPWWG
jgi:hypothetical protein